MFKVNDIAFKECLHLWIAFAMIEILIEGLAKAKLDLHIAP